MENIDQIIQLNEKKTALLKELKESIIYEDCLYDVRQTPSRISDFMLFEISTGKEVRNGNAGYIRAWLERRNIPADKVYNYDLIKEQPPAEQINS